MLSVPFPTWFLLAKNTLDLVYLSEDKNVRVSLSIFAFCRLALTSKLLKRTVLGHGVFETPVAPDNQLHPG